MESSLMWQCLLASEKPCVWVPIIEKKEENKDHNFNNYTKCGMVKYSKKL